MKALFKKHSYGVVTVVTILILLGFSYQVMAYLIGLKAQPLKRPPQNVIRRVHAQPVAYETITSPVTEDGRVVSTEDIVISTEVRGQILVGDVPFKKGQSFRRGDVLLRVFDGNVDMSLRSRKSGFLQKIAAVLPDIKVDFPESYARWTAFFQAVDFESDLPDLPEVGSEQEKIFIASRSILTEYYSIKSDEITLDKYVITAPFDGTFTDVLMEVGAIASPGASLAKIIRTDVLELEVPVEVSDAAWIKIGDSVDVFDEVDETSWDGRVIRISSFVESNTQSRSVFVTMKSTPGQPVYVGQYLKAVFSGHPISGVMEIPREAVFNFNDVFVVEDGKLAKRTVELRKVNEDTVLISGLEEGVELVVEQLINTMEDTFVEIIRETRG